MNKPNLDFQPADDDFGPLDEHGQQIWSPEDEAAIARLVATPSYRSDIAAGLASIERGQGHTTGELLTELARRRAAR